MDLGLFKKKLATMGRGGEKVPSNLGLGVLHAHGMLEHIEIGTGLAIQPNSASFPIMHRSHGESGCYGWLQCMVTGVVDQLAFWTDGEKGAWSRKQKKEKCMFAVGLPLQRLGACCEVALCMTRRIHSVPGPLLIQWQLLV